jgi:hypothetical protein
VPELVLVKTAEALELAAAQVADVVVRVRVDLLVHPERAPVHKLLAALLARVLGNRRVGLAVGLEQQARLELFSAGLAGVLEEVAVGSDVRQKFRQGWKFLLAEPALADWVHLYLLTLRRKMET